MSSKSYIVGALAATVTGVVSIGTLTAPGDASGSGVADVNADQAATGQLAQRPNIVLITTDDQRVEDLWAMPTVRRLLSDPGTTFRNSYAPFPLCGPARASILTGQYPHNHGVLDNGPPLGGFQALDSRNTFATSLQSAGYRTAEVGKYVNGYGAVKPVTVPPGWTEWHGEVAGGDYFDTRLFEDGVSHEYVGPYQVDLVSNISAGIINRRAPATAPFFLWESYAAPHVGGPKEPDDPNIRTPAVPPRYHDAFAGVPLHPDPSFNEADVSDKPAYVSQLHKLTSTMQGMMTESYEQRLESLQAVDEAVAKTVQTLANNGELSNTIIAFTSDNGWMMGEHRIHAGKTVPYEPSARVPLIVRGPGFPAGVVRKQLVANIDLAPTFIAIGGASPGLPLDGTSLLPLAADPANGTSRRLLFETGPPTTDGYPTYTGVRTTRWLYLKYGTGESELYDLANDPYELRNLAANPSYANQRRWLSSVLASLRDCAGATCR